MNGLSLFIEKGFKTLKLSFLLYFIFFWRQIRTFKKLAISLYLYLVKTTKILQYERSLEFLTEHF